MWIFLFSVEEVEKYSDPSYTEADIFIPDAVKYQLVASEEQRLKDALENFEKIETLKHVLDSQAIAGTLLHKYCIKLKKCS